MKIISITDKNYPKILSKIKNPPKKLWTEGNIELLGKNAISIIGSRKNSEYGAKWCEKFTKELLEYDLTIVSGMASGIDSIAHNTCLKYKGKTIAVLPSGFDNIYPIENKYLYKKIIENDGLVISEYPPEIKASKEKFLERNRIVSGFGLCTLVIEAGYRSGTSVTAKITISEGKKVFCIPGNLNNKKRVGTNRMIQNGAQLVMSVNDIILNYPFLKKKKNINDSNLNVCFDLENIDEDCLEIYKMILNGFNSVNKIAKNANISINETMSKITMLEIEGKIKKERNGKICIANLK